MNVFRIGRFLALALLVNGTVVDASRGLERGNDQLLAESDKVFASNP